MKVKEIKGLNDRDLLELEHDTMVDCIQSLSGDLTVHKLYKRLVKEMEKRKLTPLPRLFGFN